jgi:hypothetical protein
MKLLSKRHGQCQPLRARALRLLTASGVSGAASVGTQDEIKKEPQKVE